MAAFPPHDPCVGAGHADESWVGDLVCWFCGRLYMLAPDETPPPVICRCGVRLLPRSASADHTTFTARALCAACARRLASLSTR